MSIPSNGHEKKPIKSSTVRTLDMLEVKVRALSLKPKDIILVTFESPPTIEEAVDFQRHVGHLMQHLALDFPVSFMIVPPGIDMKLMSEEDMRRVGWQRIPDEVQGT